MSLVLTLVVLAGALVATGVAAYQDRKPYVPGRTWRVPYKGVMFVALVLAAAAVAHLISLAAGTPLKSRFGF